jgi:hypothetical protein
MKKKKDNRGGAGRGQGRKKGVKLVPYRSTPVRVPDPILPSVRKQIEEFKAKFE